MRSSRRRLATFCALPLVSNQMTPSMTAYHMATRWGWPLGPIVAIVAVRLCSMNAATSSSLIVICARWFVPTARLPLVSVVRRRRATSAGAVGGADLGLALTGRRVDRVGVELRDQVLAERLVRLA